MQRDRFDPFGPVAYYTTPPEQSLVYDSYVNLAEVLAIHFYTTRGVPRALIHLAHHQQPTPEVRDLPTLAVLRTRLEGYAQDAHWFCSTGTGTEESTHFLNLAQVEAVRFYRLQAFPEETLALVYAGNHEATYELSRMNSTREDLGRLEGLFRGEIDPSTVADRAERPATAPPPPPPPPPAALPPEPRPVAPNRRAPLPVR